MKYLILLFIAALVILAVGVLTHTDESRGDKSSITEQKVVTISQYQLKQMYGWKDIILWSESKDAFESAYQTKLHWINYPMGFKKDPSCISPVGGDDWIYDKICYQYVVPLSTPHMIDSIAKLSKGNTLVIIGTTHNNMQNFYGNAYWY